MSNNMEQNNEEQQEKVVTKYDLKMQRRAEEKKKDARDKKVSGITGVIVLVAIAIFVLSFPIRSYLTVNGTFIKVGGEKVTKVEFDYNYNLVKNNYINQYSYYMSMFGIDLSGDLSKQSYGNGLSWQDYFEQMAVDNIVNNKALAKQAAEEGFTYDASEDYASFEKNVRATASKAGMSEREYVKQTYGSYATMSRLKKYIMKAQETSRFYSTLQERNRPSDEEVQAKYDEDPSEYDSVDYRLVTINAELPTEPTELADPVEETAEESDSTEEADGEEEAYTPSEAEVQAAMVAASVKAHQALNTITEEELVENKQKSDVLSNVSDWLFDAERKQGDSTVIENTSGNCYYVVEFEKRYLDQTPTVDARIILTADKDGDAILEQWKNGEATEESFGKLADEKNGVNTSGVVGGLYEALTPAGLDQPVTDWLFAADRKPGDTTSVLLETGTTFVMYYVGTNDPQWKNSIRDALLSDVMQDYVDALKEGIEVEDKKGNLNYLKVQASQEAASAESAAEESSDAASDESGAEESSEESTEEVTEESSEESTQAAEAEAE